MSDNFLQQLPPSRRAFVKRLVAAGAAAPVIASFSIGALAQCVNSGSSSAASSQSGSCQPDPGYVGPGRFAAHLSYVGSATDTGGRSNGEVHFVVNKDDKKKEKDPKGGKKGKTPSKGGSGSVASVATQLDLVADSALVFQSAYILINGTYAVNVDDGTSSIDDTDVNYQFSDLDFVLDAMASGLATVLVQATYLGNPINLSGAITAAGPGFDFVNLPPAS